MREARLNYIYLFEQPHSTIIFRFQRPFLSCIAGSTLVQQCKVNFSSICHRQFSLANPNKTFWLREDTSSDHDRLVRCDSPTSKAYSLYSTALFQEQVTVLNHFSPARTFNTLKVQNASQTHSHYRSDGGGKLRTCVRLHLEAQNPSQILDNRTYRLNNF